MNNTLKTLADSLKSSFRERREFGLYDFIKVENILYLLSVISPELNPHNAYVLLRGYQIINHSIEDEKLFLLQQARIKFLVYASRMQWEQDLSYYLDDRYSQIRLYNIDENKLVKTAMSIPGGNREDTYLSNLRSNATAKKYMSSSKGGKYRFYRQDKSSITVQIPDWDVYGEDWTNDDSNCGKAQREKISISYEELLNTASEMRKKLPTDYCYDVLKNNTIESVKKMDKEMTS